MTDRETFWQSIRRPAEQTGPLDYGCLPLGPVIDKDAETVMVKEDDYGHALVELARSVREITAEVARHLDRKVSAEDLFPEAVAVSRTDGFAQAAGHAPARWLDRHDWEGAAIEQVRTGIRRARLDGYAELFDEDVQIFAREAGRLSATARDRAALSDALAIFEKDHPWCTRWKALDKGNRLSRACAELALSEGTPIHFSHRQAAQGSIAARLAASRREAA